MSATENSKSIIRKHRAHARKLLLNRLGFFQKLRLHSRGHQCSIGQPSRSTQSFSKSANIVVVINYPHMTRHRGFGQRGNYPSSRRYRFTKLEYLHQRCMHSQAFTKSRGAQRSFLYYFRLPRSRCDRLKLRLFRVAQGK